MKKHITLLSGLLLVSGAFAQNAKVTASPRMAQQISTTNKKVTPGTSTPNKALGTVVWNSDFSDPTDWVIDNDAQTGGNFGWNINATKEGWANNTTQGIINSVSDGNFAELGNGVPPGTSTPGTMKIGVDYYLTSAAPVTISTQQLVLSFMQNGALFNDLQEFQISVNGTNWITVGNNTGKGVLSQSGGAAYTNPTLENINLSSYIPNGSTQLWVRFHWTSRFPAETGGNAWLTYGWNIDDVAIMTLPDYDLSITNDYWGTAGLGYFQIPTTQIAPIDFSLNVDNAGGSAMTNVVYGVGITGAGTYTGTSAAATIAAGASDSLFTTPAFTPAAVGTYNVVRTLTSDFADDVPTNNPLNNFSFNVTNYIYARDNNVPNGYSTNQADPFETGNFFDIWAPQTLKGADVRFATGTPTTGSQVYVRLYRIDPTQTKPVYVEESPDFELTAAQINTNITVMFNSPVSLMANTTYLLMVGSYSPDVKVANAGTSADQTSFLLDGTDMQVNTLYYQNETPMVRMNFDPTLSLQELTSATDVTVYPNPFVGSTEIKFNLKADAKVSAVITDVAGRTVATVPASNMSAGEQTISIDGTSFVAGIYNYTLTVGNETITKRIVKK